MHHAEALRRLVAEGHRLVQEADYLSAPDAMLAAARDAADMSRPDAAALYARALDMFSALHAQDPAGPGGEACLQRMLFIAHDLWGFDRDRYPLTLALSFSLELLRRHPNSVVNWDAHASLLSESGHWVEAVDAARRTLALAPHWPPAWCTMGRCQLALGDAEGGRASYETALRLSTRRAQDEGGHYSARLFLGHYGAGWGAWAHGNDQGMAGRGGRVPVALRPLVGRPTWDGRPLSGRLLLNLEHGYGDSFMMLRWVSLIRARVGALRLRVRPELLPVLRGQWPEVEVVTWNDDPGDFEAYVLSYSLPHLFGVTVPEDLPPASCLRAPERFRPLAGEVRVGLRWAGLSSHTEDLARSATLAELAPLLQVPGVTFYSLQLDKAAEQLQSCGAPIHDLGPELTDWGKTAAALMELDLIISVDTSVAHLAGALGRPVWICLAAVPEWRWMLDRTDTPWYGSARLFRQSRVGEWPALFEQVARALQDLVTRRDRALAGAILA